jgi:hypothetical protein
MARRFACLAIATGLLSAVSFLLPAAAVGQQMAPGYPPNYYMGPGAYGGVTAALYPCPRPTPPLVGWTYITYQPFAPQQMLNPHCDCYCQHQCDGGKTHTLVLYCHTPSFCPTVRRQVPVLCTPPVHVSCPSE